MWRHRAPGRVLRVPSAAAGSLRQPEADVAKKAPVEAVPRFHVISVMSSVASRRQPPAAFGCLLTPAHAGARQSAFATTMIFIFTSGVR
jgi:hypothetical protein